MHCCKGYCMDLLKHLAIKINVTYDLSLSPDGQFGNYILKNDSSNFFIIFSQKFQKFNKLKIQ